MGSVLFSMLNLFIMVNPCFGEADLKITRVGEDIKRQIIPQKYTFSRTTIRMYLSTFLYVYRALCKQTVQHTKHWTFTTG